MATKSKKTATYSHTLPSGETSTGTESSSYESKRESPSTGYSLGTEQNIITVSFAFVALYLIWKHKLLAWAKNWMLQPPKGS